MKSYVISVSAGKGCYRHIHISAGSTLYNLHQKIIDAFDMIDDHAHAFFMDNRTWSKIDSYYSDRIEDETRYTFEFTLESLGLQAGKKFKYVFDFGDEWVFQCRVLRVLDESCPEPAIVKSSGEAPRQYESIDEILDIGSGEDDYPDVYPPEVLSKLYKMLALPEETAELLHRYFKAMARLYGVIPLKKALEIINTQNDPISEHDFLAFAEIVRHEDNYYGIFGKEELYGKGKTTAPLDREIIEQSLYMIDLTEYEEVINAQQGKPYYIPSKEELLKYADSDYYEQTPQRRAIHKYLRSQKGLTKAMAEVFELELLLHAEMDEDSMDYVINDMTRMGLSFDGIEDIRKFITLYTELLNHSRTWYNRGYKPTELLIMKPSENRDPKSVLFGPNIIAALQNDGMNMEELRQGVLRMELPDENLRQSIFNEISRIGLSSPASAAVKKGKPGRNDPCPCGSGKKYKKCCGRDQ